MHFIVTYRGDPVRFTINPYGKNWEVCKLADATVFESEDEARVKLVDWSVHGNALFEVRRKEEIRNDNQT